MEAVTEIARMIPDFVELLCTAVTVFVLLATAISRITFWTKKDDEFVDGVAAKVLSFLPTFGKSVRTAQLERMVKELQEGKKGDEVSQEAPVTEQAS